MDVPVTFDITKRSTAEKSDAPKDDEDPANDRDREWPPFHSGHRLHGSWADLLTGSGFSFVVQSAATECQ